MDRGVTPGAGAAGTIGTMTETALPRRARRAGRRPTARPRRQTADLSASPNLVVIYRRRVLADDEPARLAADVRTLGTLRRLGYTDVRT